MPADSSAKIAQVFAKLPEAYTAGRWSASTSDGTGTAGCIERRARSQSHFTVVETAAGWGKAHRVLQWRAPKPIDGVWLCPRLVQQPLHHGIAPLRRRQMPETHHQKLFTAPTDCACLALLGLRGTSWLQFQSVASSRAATMWNRCNSLHSQRGAAVVVTAGAVCDADVPGLADDTAALRVAHAGKEQQLHGGLWGQ